MANAIMTVGGQPLTIAGKLALLFSGEVVTPPPVVVPDAPMPTASMAGWWDASVLSTGQTYSTLTDKSVAGKNASSVGTAGGSVKVAAHMAGMLSGLFVESSPYIPPYGFSELYPVILDYTVSASNVAVGTGGALTVFLVWTRPNQKRVSGVYVTEAVPIINVNGGATLSLTGNGNGSDTLLLNNVPVGTLALRHTHSVRLVYSGTTLDLWLDGVKIVTGAATTQLGATANISFLNAAHCIFHEAAAWSKVLTTPEHTDLTGYSNRWPLGARRAINFVLLGQSNAGYQFAATGLPAFARRVAYLTGCASANLLGKSGTYGQLESDTIFSGQGLYNTGTNLFLTDNGGDPSTWPLAANGNAFMTALNTMTADELANFRGVIWLWSESDSVMLTPSMKTKYVGAVKRAIALIRSHVTKTAAQLPVVVIDALPFTTDEGCQTHRQAMADLCADATVNVHMGMSLSGDATGEGTTWDATTGIESGTGNGGHRDMEGHLMYARRLAIPAARAALAANAASNTPDKLTAIDPSIPVKGGPKVTAALKESATSVLVTVTHDGGNDLVVPLRAAVGAGWTLNGLIIKATACVRVSATQLRLTFPDVPTGATLYYAYGSNLTPTTNFTVIGRGNAVTDNFSTVTLTAGWRIGTDLGDIVSEQPNNPLHATPYGVVLT